MYPHKKLPKEIKSVLYSELIELINDGYEYIMEVQITQNTEVWIEKISDKIANKNEMLDSIKGWNLIEWPRKFCLPGSRFIFEAPPFIYHGE